MIDACLCLSFVGCYCKEFRIKYDGDPEGECKRNQVKAVSHERAAVAWAEQHDSEGDYDIASGGTEEVEVCLLDGSDPKKFRVSGYQTTVYEAKAV